jgi:dihydrofolate synthase/folylpolyglutamate synthase
LEEIARHKAGAIKPNVPVVLGPTAVHQHCIEQASLCCSPLFPVSSQAGFYDEENQTIAAQAAKLLRPYFSLAEEAIEEGLKVRPACRFEIQGNVVLDVAHNLDGLQRLLEALDVHFPGRPFKVVLGLSQDKDVRPFLRKLASKASHIFLVKAATPRAASVAEMAKILQQENYTNFTTNKTVAEALTLTRDELVVVCGTFYIMQEVQEHITRSQVGAQ